MADYQLTATDASVNRTATGVRIDPVHAAYQAWLATSLRFAILQRLANEAKATK